MEGGVYRCTCGTPDASRKWIHCDNDECQMGWYHRKCAGVTEKPRGEWLCARCSVQPTGKTEPLEQGQGGNKTSTSTSSKLWKTAGTGLKGGLHRGGSGGHGVANKGHGRMKKGTAIKKPPPKKKIGWVETSSESEGDDKDSVEAARKAITVAEGRRTKARATHSRRAQALRSTSKLAAGVRGKARAEPKERKIDG